MRSKVIAWVAVAALTLMVTAQFLLAPEVALQYWYLLSAPLIVAAYLFGLRGALLVAIFSMLVMGLLFVRAEQAFGEVAGFLEGLIQMSTSPSEARDLALQLADLRTAEPRVAAIRSLIGLTLAIVGSLLLGTSVDRRAEAGRSLAQASRLRRYFSPQILDAITSQADEGGFSAISARKELTILFADLRNFTALSERVEPEEVVHLLNEFFTAMTEEVFREGGTLDKYVGDEVMAFFGDPLPYPDHAERAVRAALAMQRRMRDLQSRWQAEGREFTGMGIGISTGHATVGNVGSPVRIDYTAVGSPVNLASRLSDIAEAGQIICSQKTYWRVQQLVAGKPRESVRVKGFPQPISATEILDSRPALDEREIPVEPRLAEIVSRVVDDSAYRALLLSSPTPLPGPPLLDEEEHRLARRVAMLCGHKAFEAVPGHEFARLLSVARESRFDAGEVIAHQGAEEEEEFYVIVDGDVVVTVLDEAGQERHVASLTRGDHFGEVALLFDTPRIATVRASSDLTLLAVGRDSFYSLLTQSPMLRTSLEAMARTRMSVPFPVRSATASAGS